MGRRNTTLEQQATVSWAIEYGSSSRTLNCSLQDIKSAFSQDLSSYFALAGLSRSTTAPSDLVNGALGQVFRVRTRIEKNIIKSLYESYCASSAPPSILFAGSFYGSSKKQGVSVRFALAGCQPTKLCGSACYGHDALDASPNAIVRGALNHFTATLYESESQFRQEILDGLLPHTRKAVRAAIAEAPSIDSHWTRAPRIRFAHLGEAAAYPNFCNALARQVADQSEGRVQCVVYTRHKNAHLLDPKLFVVNFTLDSASENRRSWIGPGMRSVFSAFGGQTSSEADVNFLEHHRWIHMEPIGEGAVCPSTLPATEKPHLRRGTMRFVFQEPVVRSESRG